MWTSVLCVHRPATVLIGFSGSPKARPSAASTFILASMQVTTACSTVIEHGKMQTHDGPHGFCTPPWSHGMLQSTQWVLTCCRWLRRCVDGQANSAEHMNWHTSCLTGGAGLFPSWNVAAYFALSASSSAFRVILRSRDECSWSR